MRSWIAVCQVAHTKYTTSINPLFRNAKAIDGKRPLSDRASKFWGSIKLKTTPHFIKELMAC
jgi:hypothetical protein